MASHEISQYLIKKANIHFKFEQVSFQFFPPATVFSNVIISKENPDSFSIHAVAKELNLNYSLFSIMSQDVEIDELIVKNGTVKIDYKIDPNEPEFDWKKINISKYYSDYQNIYSQIPVKFNFIKSEEVIVNINSNQIKVDEAVLSPSKYFINIKSKLSDIKIDHKVNELRLNLIKDLRFNLSIKKDQIKVKEISAKVEDTVANISGDIVQSKKELSPLLSYSLALNLESIEKYFDFKIKELKGFKGRALIKGNTKGDYRNLETTAGFEIESFISPYFVADRLGLKISLDNNHLVLKKLSAKNKQEEYFLKKEVPFFNLSKLKFINLKTSFELKNAKTNTFLYAIKKTLDPLKATINGKVEVSFDGEKVYFNVEDKTKITDLKLVFGKSTPILDTKNLNVKGLSLSLDHNYRVQLKGILDAFETNLKLDGYLDDKGLDFSIKDSKINLESLGPISGVKLKGTGPVDLKIYGPYEDVVFDFNVQWKKFSLVNLNLGEVRSRFTLTLDDLLLSFQSLSAVYGSTKYEAIGWLKFGDNASLDLKINVPESNFTDAKEMYALVFNGMKLPPDLALKFSSNYRIYGSYALEALKIAGQLKGREVRLYGEDFDSLALNFTLSDKKMNINPIRLKKGRGEASGTANIALENGFVEIEGVANQIRLSEINFYKKFKLSYDSDLSFSFEGNGVPENFSSRIKFKTIEPSIFNYPASNSNGLIYLSTNDLVAKLNLLGNKVKLDTIYEFDSDQVFVKSVIDTSDLRELFGALLGHNFNDKSITGYIKAILNTKFNSKTFNISKFNLDIRQFLLKRDNVNLKVENGKNQILVEEGVVKKWDVVFLDGKEYFKSYGENIGNAIVLTQAFDIKSEILEIANSLVEKSTGIIRGSNRLSILNGITFDSFRLTSTKSTLKVRNVPGLISNLNYDVIKNDNRFELLNLNGKYGEGDFKATGNITFETIYPALDLDIKVERSIVPLFKKSNLLVNGSGQLTGNDLPYNFVGKLSVVQGDILDDPNEILSSAKVNLDEFNKYLPTKNDAASSGFVKLNLAVDTTNAVSIKNNLAEVYLKVGGQVSGNLINPELNIRAETQNNSKFKFKGNDFNLSQGLIEIIDRGKNRTSNLKFTGVSKINEYDVKLDISGRLDKVDINLTSEPVRSQEDILSLLAFGVTADMNKNLDPTERARLNTVGIGTLFLNQFKINENINNTIGVNLSVAPEFQEEDSKMVASGKSAINESGSSKLKSATKIKINKKINNVVDVGVSSTVGGSIEPKQEMNANIKVNNNLSVEGVYEIKPTEDESTATPTSLGVDLKYKWSF